MKLQALVIGLFLVNFGYAATQTGVSALVETVPIRKMELANRINGYGTVIPEPGATENLNLSRSGQVMRLLVSAGQSVKKGQILLELGPDPTGLMSFGQAKNAVSFAKQELTRTQSLFARQLATHSQIDAADKALKDAEQVLAAQNAQGNGDQKTLLTAPFSGLVVATLAAQGDRVQAGANLVQLSHTAYMRSQLGIEPGDSRQLRTGMSVRLTSVFDPRHPVTGTVVQVGGQIDPQTQLVAVTVRIAGGVFLPGSRVRGEIAATSHTALAVPRSAVLRDDTGAFVFQVVNGKAKRFAVETGVEDGDWVEVKGTGLLNSPVVSVGNYELNDGMTVRESKP